MATQALISLNKKRFGGQRQFILKRDNWSCVNCGMTNKEHIEIFKRQITIDHIDGCGRNSINPNNSKENLQTLCLKCHGKKDFRKGCPIGSIRFYKKRGVLRPFLKVDRKIWKLLLKLNTRVLIKRNLVNKEVKNGNE